MSPLSIKGAMKSAGNHIIFILVFFSVPMSLLFGLWAYQDQKLTLAWAARIVIVWAGLGVAIALIGWHVILSPIRRRLERK